MIVEFIENTDHRTNQVMENNQTPFATQSFKSLTTLGSAYLSLVIIGILWSFSKPFIAKQLALGVLITGVTIFALKFASKRERPKNHVENVFNRASFPSGHSGNAFMTATILSAHLGRIVGFFALALTVAVSRVYLEDHYVSDVVAGSGIGLVIGQVLITV